MSNKAMVAGNQIFIQSSFTWKEKFVNDRGYWCMFREMVAKPRSEMNKEKQGQDILP
jgi:hypothetical protein